MGTVPACEERGRGIIQVDANDPKDTTSRDNNRMHLTHAAKAFSSGDFAIPMFVHDTVPPGVPARETDKRQYPPKVWRDAGRGTDRDRHDRPPNACRHSTISAIPNRSAQDQRISRRPLVSPCPATWHENQASDEAVLDSGQLGNLLYFQQPAPVGPRAHQVLISCQHATTSHRPHPRS